MQVLKDEIYNSIIQHAEALFYERGFTGASMRELAQKVGISFSNLYRYFKNKNDLYDTLMQPYYAGFMDTIRGSLAHEEREPAGEDHVHLVLEMFMRLIRTDRKKFVILLEGSQGTKYEPVRAEMIAAIRERIDESLPGRAQQFPLLIQVLAANLLQAILEITMCTPDDETLLGNLEYLVVYHLGGIEKLNG